MKRIRILTKCDECGSNDNLYATVENEVLCERCIDQFNFTTCSKCGKFAYDTIPDDKGNEHCCHCYNE